ncbi:MAG: glycosyltransferase family 4 protein [Candidatus Krumholzibacteriia bacterium]
MNAERPVILILSDSMVAGGLERQIVELLRGLRASGRFATLFGVLDRHGLREREAAALADANLSVARRWRYDFSAALSLPWLARRHRVALIHTWGWMGSLAGLATARLLHLPLLNGSIRNAPPVLGARDRLSRRILLASDAIVANSRAGLRAFALAGHPRASIIRNGVDLARFTAVTPRDLGPAAVCMVGNFTPNKDQAALIRSLPDVLAAEPAARLVLVGRGSGPLAACRQLARDLNVADRVEFVTDTNDPEPWVAASRVCVLVSNARLHGEGTSNAIIEYMALGKPVVANDCGGSREVVIDGETGFVVPDAGPTALAAPVVRLLHDPASAARMGAAGRDRALREYGVERMVSEYESLYRQLLSQAGGRGISSRGEST